MPEIESATEERLVYDRSTLTQCLTRARQFRGEAVTPYSTGWWDGYIRLAETMLGIEVEEEE